MDILSILLFGIATAGNVAVLKWKLEKERYSDAIVDAVILVSFAWLFSGTISGLAVATIASAFISIYLLFSPPDKLIKIISEMDDTGKKKKKKKKKKKYTSLKAQLP